MHRRRQRRDRSRLDAAITGRTLDPRLNYEQAMEMALLLARLMAQNRK